MHTQSDFDLHITVSSDDMGASYVHASFDDYLVHKKMSHIGSRRALPDRPPFFLRFFDGTRFYSFIKSPSFYSIGVTFSPPLFLFSPF